MEEDKKNKISPISPNREITEELKESFLSYSMSVIIDRALPDVRDGLKPVHRRILWAMWDSGLNSSSKLRKSANVVGEVLGRYHPHGDLAVYDAMARLAQNFSLRYPLIQGQGNWGSIDGDSPAAMRYTECRMGKIAEEMLFDIEKETVDWKENYDSTRLEPKVLPAKIPQLLINGTMGIAVGMATAIPPHNLSEVIDATTYLIDNPKSGIDELVKFVKGPDFPTGGIIYNKKDISEAYITGRGAVTTRALAEITERKGKEKSGQFDIVISEIPYQVNKSELIRHIAELVIDKRIEGIKDVRDESDKDGLRIVIELKNDVPPQKILNQLFKHTDLQKNFNFNMIALVDGQKPELLSLKEILEYYIAHRVESVTRRTRFELKKAKEREHILLGLAKALSVIDKVIATIKKSKNREDASINLIKNFKFSEIQTNAILDMRLQSLAALERQKIEDELAEKKKLIARLEALLKSPAEIRKVIKNELLEIKEKFGDERRTKVVSSGVEEFSDEDLIPEEEAIITFSASGYIKRLPPASFKSQKRGGKGLIGSELGEEDMVSQFLNASTHDNILFFTDKGKVFQTKVYEIPVASRVSKGKAIANFLEIPSSDRVSAIVAYSDKGDSSSNFLVMATRDGVIKKTPLADFKNVRRSGIIAITLKKDDELKWVSLSSGKDEIIISSVNGQAIRFKETDVRPMGRASSGVISIKLKKGDRASSMDIITPESKDGRLLAVMENGYGKQTPLKEYKIQKRGGSGIKTANVTAKTGKVIAARVITNEEELFALSAHGQIIKTELKTVRLAGRSTQGVRIMNVKEGDKVAGIVCL